MNKKQIKEKIKEYKDNLSEKKSFSDFISKYYSNKIVEICVSLEFERISREQTSNPIYATIYGKIIDSVNNFLVLDCFTVDGNKISDGNIVFINEYEIVSLQPFSNKCNLSDVFMKHDSKIVDYIKSKV